MLWLRGGYPPEARYTLFTLISDFESCYLGNPSSTIWLEGSFQPTFEALVFLCFINITMG
jgi:hypothetical protein